MLEDRLTVAYSQHNLGHGAVPGAAQYPNLQSGFPAHASDIQSGAENFYYGNQMDSSRQPNTMYAPQQVNGNGFQGPPSAVQNPAYSSQPQRGGPTKEPHSHTWGGNTYPTLGSPSPSNTIPNNYTNTPAQYYAGPHDADSVKSPGADPAYQPSPVMRRDSQYQASGPPSGPTPVPEQHTPAGYVQSPGYSVPPTAPALHQQATGPSQSYYYQSESQSQQPPNTVPSAYPSINAGQPGYAQETSQPPYQQPARPVEENLIEL
jgi:growth factor-regulated tyrosine kinase substrate